jgi:signal transduction histidine kinase
VKHRKQGKDMIAQENQLPHKETQVLIIDDSRSIQQFVGELLHKAGYAVSNAGDGESGLALIETCEPDVVLLDVEMPGMNGLQVLDKLAGKRSLFAIILFTSRSSLEQIVEGLNKGADDYIVKPFQPDELLARVASAKRSVVMKRELAFARQQADEALASLRESQSQLVEEKKIQAIAHLAAGFAHEINNPLGFIRSNLATLGRYAEFLLSCINSNAEPEPILSSADDGSSAVVQKKMKVIRNDMSPLIMDTQSGFTRIAEIVRNFIDLEKGLGANEAQEENLNDILAGIVNDFGSAITGDLRVTFDLDPAPLPFMGVLTMLNTIFVNLVRNAMEAVGSKGEIRIRSGRDSGSVFCELHDSGSGINAEDCPHIFDPFFTTKVNADVNHFGLGLTIAECFVNAHGGSIEITSPEGGGTRAMVSFPVAGRKSQNERFAS